MVMACSFMNQETEADRSRIARATQKSPDSKEERKRKKKKLQL